MIQHVLFDLDETLYPSSNGLMPVIGSRMRDYIATHYGLPLDEAYALQKRYWVEYGTTLRGLYVERGLAPQEYLRYVHDVPVSEYVAPDPRLRAMLETIPQEKSIVTNADAVHARRILTALGVSDLFPRIFDVVFFEYECKPSAIVYERVLAALGARGADCALVEDMARNLPAARALGIHTILVGAADATEADARIATIYEVTDALARLDGHGA